MIRTEHQFHDLASLHESMLISSNSHKLLYVVRKAKEERISAGLVFKERGQISKAVELPVKDILILIEELKDILEVYF